MPRLTIVIPTKNSTISVFLLTFQSCTIIHFFQFLANVGIGSLVERVCVCRLTARHLVFLLSLKLRCPMVNKGTSSGTNSTKKTSNCSGDHHWIPN